MNTRDPYTRLVIETVKESAHAPQDDLTQKNPIPQDMLQAGVDAFMHSHVIQGKSLYLSRLAASAAMSDFVPPDELEDSPLDDHLNFCSSFLQEGRAKMDAMHYFDARRIKCSCHPYKHGEVIHTNGVLMNLCWSWVCLRCFQAHVTFFEVQNDRLIQVHDESFVCIADLPEALQFDWAEWDDDGHLMYWDRRMEPEDGYAIRALRKKLELPDLDEDLSGRWLRRDLFTDAIPF